MDTSKVRQAKRRTTKYVYACTCGSEVKLGAIRHKKQQRGVADYHHKCHTVGKLTFTGKAIKS
jgi:predicted SprT family Zn-dependent metalloprotease